MSLRVEVPRKPYRTQMLSREACETAGTEMFAIDFYGSKADGTLAGPGKVKFPGERLPDAITAAHILMQTNTFSWGRATSFKIFEEDLVLVYSSDQPPER